MLHDFLFLSPWIAGIFFRNFQHPPPPPPKRKSNGPPLTFQKYLESIQFSNMTINHYYARLVIFKMAKNVKRKNNANSSALKNFLAGGVGGICLVIAGHPLDTIKVRNIHPILVHCIHT